MSDRTILVIGGEAGFSPTAPANWSTFVAGKAISVELESAAIHERLRYVTPEAERCPSGDNILFKSASLSEDHLTLVTETEVLSLERPSLKETARVSHPWMNDVHHALAMEDGGHLVMSTGLDLVLRLDANGHVVARWYVGRGRLWGRFDRDQDYRKIRSTQPHHSHANFLAIVGADLWVTRYQDEDVLVIPEIMTHPGFDELPGDLVRHALPGGPHDGVRRGELTWYTLVSGLLIGMDAAGSVARTIDLNRAYGHGEPLGWCRGLHWTSTDEVLVGFSAYRHRRYGSLIGRCRARTRMLMRKSAWAGPLPSEGSRIVRFDVSGDVPQVLSEYEVEGGGLRDIFSILRL